MIIRPVHFDIESRIWVAPTNNFQVSEKWTRIDYSSADKKLGIIRRLELEPPPLDTPPDEEQESSLGTIMNQWESEKERVERTYREVIKHYNSFITPHGLETVEVEEGLTPEEQLERCDVMLREMIELRNAVKARHVVLAKRHSDVRERFGGIVGRRSSDEGEE